MAELKTNTTPDSARHGDSSFLFMAYEHADDLLASVIFAVVIVASFWRLRFGVDFSDEAFYAAITQRFALGDWPYLDDYNLRQTGSLLPVPFYWLYIKIVGSTDGVVYFLRVLYFAVQLGVVWSVYRLSRLYLTRAFSLVCSTLPIVFIPFQIPTCSYNSLAAMLFTGGVFVGLYAVKTTRPQSALLAGVLHGLGCVAYPPIAIAVAVYSVALGFVSARLSSPEKQIDGFVQVRSELGLLSVIKAGTPFFSRFAAGVISVGVMLLAVVARGVANGGVSAATSYERMTTTIRNLDKAKDVVTNTLALVPGGSGWLATLGAFGLIAKVYPTTRRWVLGALVLYLSYFFHDTQPGYPNSLNSMYLSIFLGLLGGFFLFFLRKIDAFLLGILGWLPSVVAGFVTAFATANVGCVNGGIGLFSGATLTLLFAATTLERGDSLAPNSDPDGASMSFRLGCLLVLATIPLFGVLSLNLKTTYRSGPIDSLTARVSMGPYKGIYSVPERVKGAEDMTRDVRAALAGAPESTRMLSYYDFPAPYLSTLTRPAMPTVWTDSRAKLVRLLPYYASHRTGQGIVFTLAPQQTFCPELEALVLDETRLLKDGGWYKIYREPR